MTSRRVALLLLLAAALPARAQAPRLTQSLDGPTWTVRLGDQPVCVYTAAASPKKPYVKELAPPGGPNVLRDAPFDHLHHHGLMFAIRANDVNFWEETPTGGVEKPVGTPRTQLRTLSGGTGASLEQTLHWVAPADADAADSAARALLVEDRVLLVSADPGTHRTRVRWFSNFTVGPAADRVHLTGSNYNGLGVRFRQDLDPVATPWVSGRKIALEGTAQSAAIGTWGALSFAAPEGPVSVAIIPGHNPGTTRFFQMLRPFSYLAATPSLDQTPLDFTKGQRFQFNFEVVVHSGPLDPADLDTLVPQPPPAAIDR